MRTEVAIIGAGPAGLLLSHLLGEVGVDSVVLETRSREYVAARIRAGILESSSVEVLSAAGLDARLRREGHQHSGIYLQWPEERHHLDFVDLVGRSVWVYGQTEVTKDLVEARDAAGQEFAYEIGDTRLQDLDTDRPSVSFTDRDGSRQRLEADVIAGCDGSFGASRGAIPETVGRTWDRTYPFAWFGILADVPPSTDELIYAWHPDGFALHSMRSESVSRLYLQVPPGTDPHSWSDDRIWDALARRLGHGQNGWELTPGPISDRSVLPMRSYVHEPMRYGRLFLAGDAAHIVPPTGAKGLNLAIADVALLAPALAAMIKTGDHGLVDSYSDRALRRVWRATHFSWWMTTMLHVFDQQTGHGDDFDAQLQLSQLRWIVSSDAGATGLAENYAGLPLA